MKDTRIEFIKYYVDKARKQMVALELWGDKIVIKFGIDNFAQYLIRLEIVNNEE